MFWGPVILQGQKRIGSPEKEEPAFLGADPNALTDAELREDFEAIFAPGNIWTIQGPVLGKKLGVAKSTLASQIMQQAAEYGYYAATNIMLKSPAMRNVATIRPFSLALSLRQSPKITAA